MISGQNKRVFQGITLRKEDQEQTNLAELASLAVSTPRQVLNDSENIQDKKNANSAPSAPVDIESLLGDGKLPTCHNCRKTIHNPNQLTNLDGQLYCKTC